MPRSKKADAASANGSASPGQGHNTKGLTEEEAAALTTHYALKILAQDKVVAMKKAELDTEASARNALFKRVSADLKITRKDFQAEVIDKLGMTEAEFLSSEKKRARLHRLAGLTPGEQIDLIAHVLPDTVDDAINAEGDGYRAGRRADDPFPPKHIAPILHPDWMRGYHAGQEFNGMQLGKAAEILARPRPGELAAAPDAPEGEEEDDADPETIKRKARALKDTGWAEPTPQEQRFEAAEPVEEDDDDAASDPPPPAVNDLQPEAVA